jgi:potassium/hydrogen antiporter
VHTGFPVDAAVLVGGVLLAVGVVVSGLAARYRVPGLLMFLALGMVIADDGLGWIHFDDTRLAQNAAAIALAAILFEGGLATSPTAVRRAGAPAALLATVGVGITAGVVALGASLVFDLRGTTVLLLGAVVASTDAAAVFSALRGEGMPARVRDLLQLESGGNDPVAVLLTVGIVEAWRTDPSLGEWVGFGLLQLAGGLVVGLAVGEAGRWLLGRRALAGSASHGVLALGIAAIAYGLAAVLGASGFLAVYLAGLVLARRRRLARGLRTFHEGLAATAQAALFLLLGLLVFPSELVGETGKAVLVTVVLIVVARPLAVAVCLPWFGFRRAEMVLVAWAGLRGAVPIVLATIPLTAGHPDGTLVFEVAFVVVVISVAIQAPTIAAVARRLGLQAEQDTAALVDVMPLESLDADVVELRLTAGAPVVGRPLRDVPLPGRSRIAVVVREDHQFLPDGDTRLCAGDTVIVVVPPGASPDPLLAWASGAPTG